MPAPPKLLIITPTLGTSAYLTQTVAAVRAIGGVDLQYLLVCPADRVQSLKADYPDCDVAADQGKTGGLYGAINAGLAAARLGWKWFTYINDDDLLSPGFAEMARRHCRSENLATVAYGDIETIDGAGASLGTMTIESNPAYFPALLQAGISPTGQQGMLFGEPVVRALGGYDLKYRVCADLDFWVRARARGFPFRYYPMEVGRFRIRPGQISGEVSLLRDQLDEITRAHFPAPVSGIVKRIARLRYRLLNLPRYVRRFRAVGMAKSLDVLAAGGSGVAKENASR